MRLQHFLEYKLIDAENLVLTVYSLVIILIILLAAKLLIVAVRRVFKRLERQNKFDVGRSYAIMLVLRYVIWVTAIALALDTGGIKITFLLAGSAALLVGLGLGLQQIFQDILSGVALLVEGSLKVNDVVQIENGIVGKVREIGIRTSKIETRDNIIMIIPNSKFITDNVINWSHINTLTRFNVKVGVAYGTDVEKVRDLLLKCADNHSKIALEPKPFVMFSDFGESSLDFELYFWTDDAFRVEITKSDLRFIINKVFKENNIQIPFPQRDVHLYKKEMD